MKRASFLIILAATLVIITVCAGITQATEPEPELTIKACNLSFQDNVYIKYAIKSDDLSDIKLLIWTSPQSDYVYGTQDSILNSIGTEIVTGDNCAIFQYNKLAAKQMTDVIYARAFVEKSGVKYYSEIKKYSILQYIYNKTGKTGTASSNQKLIDLLNEMIEYGGRAQIYCDYNPDRLANSDWYQVKVINGLLADQCDNGLYLAGDTVSLSAPAINDNNEEFSCWIDSSGFAISTDNEFEVAVGSFNNVYTALYGLNGEIPMELETLSFVLSDDESFYIVSGIGNCINTEIVIPEEYNGLPVCEIADYAFSGCEEIISITIPESIYKIGYRAFYGCAGLEEFTIPESVTDIGKQIFYRADNISTVYYNSPYYPSSETENQFLNNSSITKIIFGGNNIGDYAAKYLGFQNNIVDLEIAGSVKYIASYAFQNCVNLENVTLNDGIIGVGNYTFKGCSKLTNIIIPNTVTVIHSSAFSSTGLKSVTIGNGVKDIEVNAFDCDYSLMNVYFNGNLGEWCSIVFDSVNSNPCKYGGSLYINGELLASAVIPDGTSAIGPYAFHGCSSLVSVSIPDSATTIGTYAFDCNNLTNIIIPDSVTSIGFNAFTKGTEKNVYYLGSINQWCSISLDDSQVLYNASFYINGEELITIDSPTGLTNINPSTFLGCKSLQSVYLPNSLQSIGGYAFSRCSNLKHVAFGEGISSLGFGAFSNCSSLESVLLPKSLLTINARSFSDCPKLIEVTIPNSVTNIGGYAFSNCSNLNTINMSSSIQSIDSYAFSNCSSLTDIIISETITSIGSYSFYNCSNLNTIYYTGTEEQWNSISFGENWKRGAGTNSFGVKIIYEYESK